MRIWACSAVALLLGSAAAEAQDSPGDRFIAALSTVLPPTVHFAYDPPTGDAAETRIANLRITQDPPIVEVTIDALTLRGLGEAPPEGHLMPVAGLEISGVRLAPAGQPGSMTIARLALTGVDIDTLFDILADNLSEPERLLDIGADQVTVEDFNVETGRSTLSLDRLDATGIALGEVARFDAAGFSYAERRYDDTNESVAIGSLSLADLRFGPLLASLSWDSQYTLYHTLVRTALGSLTLRDLEMVMRSWDGPQQVTLSALALSGLADGVLTQGRADDFAYRLEQQSSLLAIGSAEVAGFGVADFLAAIQTDDDEAFARLSRLDLDSLSVRDLRTENAPPGIDFTLSKLVVDGITRQAGLITGHRLTASFALGGEVLSQPGIRGFVEAAGMTQIAGGVSYSQSLDGAAGRLAVDDLRVMLGGWPLLTGSVALGNVPVGRYLAGLRPHDLGLDRLGLDGAALQLHGEHVVAPLIAAIADATVLPEAAVGPMLREGLRVFFGTIPADHPAGALLAAIEDFFDSAGTLQIAARPAAPVSLLSLVGRHPTSPVLLVEQLGLEFGVP